MGRGAWRNDQRNDRRELRCWMAGEGSPSRALDQPDELLRGKAGREQAVAPSGVDVLAVNELLLRQSDASVYGVGRFCSVRRMDSVVAVVCRDGDSTGNGQGQPRSLQGGGGASPRRNAIGK